MENPYISPTAMNIIQVGEIVGGFVSTDYDLKDGDTTIYDGEDVMNEMLRYSYMYTSVYFNVNWQTFKKIDWHSFLRVHKALEMTYNPINNYDNTEKSVDSQTHGDELVTTAPGTTQTVLQPSKTQTKNFYTTDENANARLSDYSETSIGDSETMQTITTLTGQDTQTTTHDTETVNFAVGDISQTTADYIQTHILTRTGNIGVTTTQAMLNEELNLRKKILLEIIVKSFADKYFFIGGEPCDINIVYI